MPSMIAQVLGAAGDDIAQQAEIGAVIDLGIGRKVHQLHRQIDQLGPGYRR